MRLRPRSPPGRRQAHRAACGRRPRRDGGSPARRRPSEHSCRTLSFLRARALASRPELIDNPGMRASAPQARAPALRVRMLDGFAVELADGRKVGPWSRPSARRLVQVLLLSTGHRLGREELAETLFPRLSPERAANAVSKALTLARAALERGGPRVLEADRATIWLREDVGLALDLDDHLASLRAALAESDSARRDELLEAALAER